jgi:hypothetical protein
MGAIGRELLLVDRGVLQHGRAFLAFWSGQWLMVMACICGLVALNPSVNYYLS